MTLKGAEGNVFDVTVGKEARNLPQVKVGDEVVLWTRRNPTHKY